MHHKKFPALFSTATIYNSGTVLFGAFSRSSMAATRSSPSSFVHWTVFSFWTETRKGHYFWVWGWPQIRCRFEVRCLFLLGREQKHVVPEIMCPFGVLNKRLAGMVSLPSRIRIWNTRCRCCIVESQKCTYLHSAVSNFSEWVDYYTQDDVQKH